LKKKKKKKKKIVKDKPEYEETFENINVHILPTQRLTCYKTDQSSRPGGRSMTTIPQLS
jgi:hypothetical protein